MNYAHPQKINMLADTDGGQGGAARMQMHGFEIAIHPPKKEKDAHTMIK